MSLQEQVRQLVTDGFDITVKVCIPIRKVRNPGVVFVLNPPKPIISGSGKFITDKPRGWGLPGGKMHDNEMPADGAMREAVKETGLRVTVTDTDILDVIAAEDSAKVYYNGRNAKAISPSGWLDPSGDREFDPYPVEEAIIVSDDDIVRLYETRDRTTPFIAAKNGNRYPVYKTDLEIAYLRVKMFQMRGV